MGYESTYPPPFPLQASSARGQVAALPFDLASLTGTQRTARCVNSLLVNHVGALAQDAHIDPNNGALTTDSRALIYAFRTPWRIDLGPVDALVDVWIYVIRPTSVDWTINITTGIDGAVGVNVNGGGTTAGIWWKAGTLAIDDPSASDFVAIQVASFGETAPAARVEAVAVFPASLSLIAVGTILGQMGRDMTPLDVAWFDADEAASTFLLQWMAAILQKVQLRGGQAYACTQQHAVGLGVEADIAIMNLDDIPPECVTATFRALVSFTNGAGSASITVGDAGVITVTGTGQHVLNFAVEAGTERRLVISAKNVTIERLSLSYDEAP